MRKPRPLSRDAGTYRDDRLFIVACEDTYAPKQYFSFFPFSRVQIHVVETVDGKGTAAHVLERLSNIDHEDDDERWMLLDTDHYIQSNHIGSFTNAITIAQQRGIKVALSRPCFELWLLLHHVEEPEVLELQNAKEVENRLRQALGSYKKNRLIPENFSFDAMSCAYDRAKSIDHELDGGIIPGSNTSRVYLLIKAIVDRAHPTRLHPSLQRIRQDQG